MAKKQNLRKHYNNRPIGKVMFQYTDWHLGEMVKLTNGKSYPIVSIDIPHNSLLLHSDEYDTDFKADCRIIQSKIS